MFANFQRCSRFRCVSNHLKATICQKRWFYVGSSKVKPLSLCLGSAQQQLKGEDSYFEDSQRNAFGVADGVGGWNSINTASPKDFANMIMSNCKNELSKQQYISAKQLLIDASVPVMKSGVIGGSTALIALLRNDNILDIANIGDSRLYIFRKLVNMGYILYFLTSEQIALFNAPLQLGGWEYVENDDYLVVDPRKWSETYSIPLMSSDIIVNVTDGVSDNLFPQTILKILTSKMNNNKVQIQQLTSDQLTQIAKEIAQAIVDEAVDVQRSSFEETPFGTPKPDDTTAVVAIASQRE